MSKFGSRLCFVAANNNWQNRPETITKSRAVVNRPTTVRRVPIRAKGGAPHGIRFSEIGHRW